MKKLTALLLALVLIISVTACSTAAPAPSASPTAEASASAAPSASPSPADTSITITDMTGIVTKLDKPAAKIVAITASDCEILFALGAGSAVIGRGEYCDYPSEVSAIPSVQSGSNMNIEQVLALKPDVVIMSKMDQTTEQVTSLEGAGIKVVMTDAQNIEGVYTAIDLIGQVVGKNDEAKTIVDGMKSTFADIKAKATGDGTKTVYFEVSPLEYGLYTAGSGTFMDEMATLLGLKNIFADMSGWKEVSEEQVLQRNPDYIITTTMSYGQDTDPVKEVLGRKGWGDITAIKDGKVYNADSNAATRPGPRLADAAKELYNFIYGG